MSIGLSIQYIHMINNFNLASSVYSHSQKQLRTRQVRTHAFVSYILLIYIYIIIYTHT